MPATYERADYAMMKHKLKVALQTLGHTRALKDGTVRLPDFEFEFEEVPAIIQAFRRMVRGLEFDVCEMALPTYLAARAYHKRFTALPIFLVRGFHHGAILYNTRLGIGGPKDLEGGKVGVNRGYTVTTGVWARGILQHEHGVDLEKITWVLSGDEHVAEFQAPSNVIPLEKGETLEAALAAGELAATIGVQVEHPDVAPLIADAERVGFEALARHGYYPISHVLVIKDSVLEAHPDLAKQIFDAFAAAKRPYLERLRNDQIAAPSNTDRMYRRVLEITGDPLPYGIAPNRPMLGALIRYAHEQGIISRPFEVDELFATGTTEWTA
jgi:ABC-type nitrate/sulfonate/bicarbonate transport system substrate-binding protein